MRLLVGGYVSGGGPTPGGEASSLRLELDPEYAGVYDPGDRLEGRIQEAGPSASAPIDDLEGAEVGFVVGERSRVFVDTESAALLAEHGLDSGFWLSAVVEG